MSVASLRARLKRLGGPAADEWCRCREVHVGERLSAAEAAARLADPDDKPLRARCPACGGRVNLFIQEVIVENREDLERLTAAERAAGGGACG